MKTLKRMVVVPLFFLLTFCAQQKHISSSYHSPKYHELSDIPTKAYKFDEKNNIFYLITNDNEQLNIHLKIADENVQKKILLFGLKTVLKINNKNYGFVYPLPPKKPIKQNRPLNGVKNRKNNPSDNFYENRQSLIAQAKMIEKISFTAEGDRLIQQVNNEGLGGKMCVTEFGELCYRITISFSDLEISNVQDEFFISAEMESGHLKSENMMQNMRQRGIGKSMQGMSGLGMRGGGRQSKMHGGRMQEMSSLSKPFKLKLGKIQLLPAHEN